MVLWWSGVSVQFWQHGFACAGCAVVRSSSLWVQPWWVAFMSFSSTTLPRRGQLWAYCNFISRTQYSVDERRLARHSYVSLAGTGINKAQRYCFLALVCVYSAEEVVVTVQFNSCDCRWFLVKDYCLWDGRSSTSSSSCSSSSSSSSPSASSSESSWGADADCGSQSLPPHLPFMFSLQVRAFLLTLLNYCYWLSNLMFGCKFGSWQVGICFVLLVCNGDTTAKAQEEIAWEWSESPDMNLTGLFSLASQLGMAHWLQDCMYIHICVSPAQLPKSLMSLCHRLLLREENSFKKICLHNSQ